MMVVERVERVVVERVVGRVEQVAGELELVPGRGDGGDEGVFFDLVSMAVLPLPFPFPFPPPALRSLPMTFAGLVEVAGLEARGGAVGWMNGDEGFDRGRSG